MTYYLFKNRPSSLHRSYKTVQYWYCFCTILFLCVKPTHAAINPVFRAGAFEIDITPTNFPVIVNGGFLSRTADKVSDPLHARFLVLDNGENRVGLCVIDTCLIPRELADKAKVLIHQATGLPPDHTLISATHTHYAPSLMQVLGTPPDPHYPDFLLPKLATGFRRAIENLTPAKIGWATIPAPEYTHTRVWIRRPDRIDTDPFGERTVRANMHPGYLNPDTIGPSGPSDPDLTLISIQTQSGKPLAVLANYAMHYHGGSQPVSADYFGVFAQKIKRLMKAENSTPPFVGIMSQGFSGDQHWMDYGRTERPISMENYAEALAKLAFQACQNMQYRDWIPVIMRDKDLPLSVRMPDTKRLAWAKKTVDSMQDRMPKNQTEVYAKEQLWLESNPVIKTKLQVLRLGEAGIAAFSGEVFAISSLKLKAQSPLRTLLNIEAANGEDGYIPPPELHVLGGYNTWACRSACLETNAEPKIVDALLEMLEEVSGKPRQKINVPLGSYSLLQLRSEPIAYWRMNEFSGPQALDTSRNRVTANYESGVVFYLDGPEKPAFCSSGYINRAPHFAGGRLMAPLPIPGSQFSVELWIWNGMPVNLRGVTGGFLSWGDSLTITGTNGVPGRLMLSNGHQSQTLSGSVEIPMKQWSMVTLTRDNSKVVVYLNGTPEIVGELPLPESDKVKYLYIGGGDNPSQRFEGKIDEVSVYDRTLGAAEVLRHFQQAVKDN